VHTKSAAAFPDRTEEGDVDKTGEHLRPWVVRRASSFLPSARGTNP
jgi:hypothetical protein